MLRAASRCCKHSGKIFATWSFSFDALSSRHESVMRSTDRFRESITRILRCFFGMLFKNREIFTWVKQQFATDETIQHDVFLFSAQSYLPCAYTQWLSLWPSSRSVDRKRKRPPRISCSAETAQQSWRICYSNSNLNSTRHTHILHHAKTSRIVAVWHPMCTRPPASCSCSEKGIRDMSGSLWWNISTETQTYI